MRRRTLVAALMLAALAAVAFTASPAVAGPFTSTAVCEDTTFNHLGALLDTGTARTADGTPRLEKETEKLSGSTEIGQKNPGTPTAGTVDVYFHIVKKSDGPGTLTQGAVDAQIAVLNLTFSGFYGGADTGFRFQLAGTDTTTSDAWFDQATFEDEIAMKTALKRGDSSDLNIYTTSGGGFLGWAYYPSITASTRFSVLDGLVIHYGSLPGGPITNFNLGYTATHEAGHWLGLAHTFEKGCIGHGDYVDDTPFMSEPTSGCPEGKDTCTRGSGT